MSSAVKRNKSAKNLPKTQQRNQWIFITKFYAHKN